MTERQHQSSRRAGEHSSGQSSGPETPGHSATAAVARLRERIDRGAGADKVAAADPAAAPLGTDDEAAGQPPQPAEVAMAEKAEAGRASPADTKPGPADLQGRRQNPVLQVTLAGVAIFLLVALVLLGGSI